MSGPRTMRVAMWSGPRNISTAMMRSWGNRPDTFVCDEPLYAHYLQQTGLDHPGAAEVMERHETDWRKVVDRLLGPVPEGRRVFYQKHMAQHLLPHIERDWLGDLKHVFLIREPREMLTSYLKRRPEMTLEDTGLPQQVEIFENIRGRDGQVPPVIDARDVLENPAGLLGRLCAVLDLPFHETMLSWPAGRRGTDGVWARYWYDGVERSTEFQPYRPKPDPVPAGFEDLHERCMEPYRRLHRHRLTDGGGA